jgi:spore maturation protein CgeB
MTRRLLLLSPAFHGIWNGLALAFSDLGYLVTPHLFDHHPSTTSRIRYKARRELPGYLGIDPEPAHRRAVTAAAVQALREHRPDFVLIVKGERLEDSFWDALDASRAKRLLWLYDDYRRIEFREEAIVRAGSVASFSHSDVERFNGLGVSAAHVPLAFDTTLRPQVQPPRAQVIFAGARYPYRERMLIELCAAGLPVRAFGREWSHHPVDRLRTWNPRRPAVPAGRDLHRAELYGHLRASAAALNVHDGVQDGFNLRTFEASGVGGVQLIDRSDVSSFYDIGTEVAVYTSHEELLALATRALSDPRWSNQIRTAARRRTLADHTMAHRARQLDLRWV